MPDEPRVVIDSNVLISRILFKHSIAAQAVRKKAVSQRIVSGDTLLELETVLSRPKFDTCLTLTDRLQLFHQLTRTARHIPA